MHSSIIQHSQQYEAILHKTTKVRRTLVTSTQSEAPAPQREVCWNCFNLIRLLPHFPHISVPVNNPEYRFPSGATRRTSVVEIVSYGRRICTCLSPTRTELLKNLCLFTCQVFEHAQPTYFEIISHEPFQSQTAERSIEIDGHRKVEAILEKPCRHASLQNW